MRMMRKQEGLNPKQLCQTLLCKLDFQYLNVPSPSERGMQKLANRVGEAIYTENVSDMSNKG